VPTDRLLTGQRLDDTGLYYYGARYYDPAIGRFISVDPVIANVYNPQVINPYSYCLNNPLRYIDPTGHISQPATQCEYEPLTDPGGSDDEDSKANLDNMWAIGIPICKGLLLDDKSSKGVYDNIAIPVIFVVITVVYVLQSEDNISIIDAFNDSLDIFNSELGAEPELELDTYPGDDPQETLSEDWEWHGKPGSEPNSNEGSWVNEKTGETLHPDFEHAPPIGPHYDYNDGRGNEYRIYPDGKWALKT
jgi:RHS repeat-associated protein